MKRFVKSLFVVLLVGIMSLFCSMAAAQDFPNKAIRLIIPFPPGGGNDITGRQITAKLYERLGWRIVVENHPGAGSIIGTEMVMRAAPNGYTLLMIATAFTSNPFLQEVPYDPVKSFTPVAKLSNAPGVLVIHPSLPVKSVKELVALAKQKPGELVFASAGTGTHNHLGGELLKVMADIDIKIVQFKGGAPSIVDLLGGHSQLSIGSLVQFMPHIKSGKLIALGTGGLQRNPVIPDVPTISEAGIPGYEVGVFFGIVAPLGTPKPIVDKLHKEIQAILALDEIKKAFRDQGAEAENLTPAEFGKFIAEESAKWGKVLKQAKAKGIK
jgi:tripartite-type tricarboxylate transporter receptor subunit TctC